ncbi:hypothetical protein ACROYT_G038248 [Oculina patagonica]
MPIGEPHTQSNRNNDKMSEEYKRSVYPKCNQEKVGSSQKERQHEGPSTRTWKTAERPVETAPNNPESVREGQAAHEDSGDRMGSGAQEEERRGTTREPDQQSGRFPGSNTKVLSRVHHEGQNSARERIKSRRKRKKKAEKNERKRSRKNEQVSQEVPIA